MSTLPIRHAPVATKSAGRRRIPVLIMLMMVVMLGVLFLAAFGPMIAPDASKQDLLDSVLPPGSPGHAFGTDQLGRDILQLAIAGTRTAIVGPIIIALGSSFIGVLLGTLAGYRRGWVDSLVSRWADLLLALPVVLVAIVVVGILGSGYWLSIALLIVLFSPSDTRIVRSVVLEEASRPYIESAEVAGIGGTRIMFVHILPNVLRMAVTNLLLNMAFALVALSGLSFLGLGLAPGTPDWGRQLADGWQIMGMNPAAVIIPAALIVVVACAINLIGDWLSERFEERGNG